jgi:hypothetical protein
MGLLSRFLSLFIRPPDPSVDVLLKLATERKEAGDLDGAIEALLTARPGMSPDVYPIQSYLKLPLYLQRTGRFQEAWLDINHLLANLYYSTRKLNNECLPMATSVGGT